MKVIFLDIDGVLNTNLSTSYFQDNRTGIRYLGIDDDKVKRLKRIVDETGAKIVLSTDWRYSFVPGASQQTESSAKYLYSKLQEQNLTVHDKTPIIHWCLREYEVKNYLEDHPNISNFVILDDRAFGFRGEEDLKEHFIMTNADAAGGGLNERVANLAIDILKREV